MSVWRDVYDTVTRVIWEAGISPSDTDVLFSIASSASHLAESVHKTYRNYFRRLGKITFERAIPFVAVFAVAMTSRWVRRQCNNDLALDRRELWAGLTAAVLRAFGDTSQEHYEEAWLLDFQFNHDCTLVEQGVGTALWHEQVLRLYLAARALGAPFTWKLSSPPIPFAFTRDLYNALNFNPPTKLELLDIKKGVKVSDALFLAEARMHSAFKALEERRQQKSK